jgi:hypothetical protein
MRKTTELNSVVLRIWTYLPQSVTDFIRELGKSSGSMPQRHEIFSLFIV